jgi:hypothetical protein
VPPEIDRAERAELERLRTELERLRAEVTELRAGTGSAGSGPAGRTGPAARGPAGGARAAGRWLAAVLLLVLSAVTGVAAVVGVFARTELLDTNSYVETVAPLARDPVVQQAVADRVTDELVTQLDLAGLTQQLADALQRQGAPEAVDGLVGPVTSGIRTFIHTEVAAVLASDQFAQVWDAANRVAHDELDAVLTTGQGQFLSVDGDTVDLDLGAILATVKQRLVGAGLTLVDRVPDISITVPLVTSEQLPAVQRWVRLLDTAAWALPLAALALLAGAVAVAPDRRRALLFGAGGLGIGMLLLLAALSAGREYYLERLPEALISRAAAAAIYDTLLRFLVAAAQSLVALAAIVAVGCWLAGPGRVATALRHAGGRLLDRAAVATARLGPPLGAVPERLHRHRRTVEVSLIIVALAVLVLWWRPGVAGTLWLAAGLAVVLALVELVGRVGGPTADPVGGATAGAAGGATADPLGAAPRAG